MASAALPDYLCSVPSTSIAAPASGIWHPPLPSNPKHTTNTFNICTKSHTHKSTIDFFSNKDVLYLVTIFLKGKRLQLLFYKTSLKRKCTYLELNGKCFRVYFSKWTVFTTGSETSTWLLAEVGSSEPQGGVLRWASPRGFCYQCIFKAWLLVSFEEGLIAN